MKKQRGITLIALVIKIVVLLILAGVSISMVVGNNGILTQATDSVSQNKEAAVKEEMKLAWASAETEFMKEYTKDTSKQRTEYFTESKLNEFLGGTFLDVVYNENGTSTVKYTKDGLIYEMQIDVNGQVTVPEKKTATELYEDFAGDEEGATEGKLHIGDYINYNPNPNNLTTEEMTVANGYKYISTNSQTGLEDAIAENNYNGTTGVTEQVFTVQSGLSWRVIGMEGNNLLITTETPIIPDSPVTVNDKSGYYLYGAKAYENCITEITNFAKIYANGRGAVKASTRGMTMTDIDNIAGVVANGTTVTPTGANEYADNETVYPYGTELTEHLKGNMFGWMPSTWLATEDKSNVPGVTGTTLAYFYSADNEVLKTATSAIRNELIFGELNYWLATRTFVAKASTVEFGPGFVANGKARSTYNYFIGGYSAGDVRGVRPVVSLSADITLTAESTTNGITTWNINL